MDVKAVIETTLKAEIIKALNAAPEAIEKLVQAAIEQPVYESTGTPNRPQYGGYNDKQLPYLDWLVGTEIRRAAEKAVREAVMAQEPAIRAEVAKRVSGESIVDAFTKEIVKTVGEDWHLGLACSLIQNFGLSLASINSGERAGALNRLTAEIQVALRLAYEAGQRDGK